MLSKEFFIPFSDLKISTKKLGKGITGSVFLGEWNGSVAAIKKVHSVNNPGLSEYNRGRMEEMVGEAQRMTAFRHPNIVEFYGFSRKEGVTFLTVMKYYREGDLYDHITRILRKHALPFSTETKLRLSLGVARGIRYIHTKKFAHLDLRPKNILLSREDENGRFVLKATICDFGLTTDTETKTVMNIGNPYFLAPENRLSQLSHDPKFPTYSSDIFSLGITLGCLFMDNFPWNICKGESIFGNGNYTDKATEKVMALAKRCASEDPDARCKIGEVVKTLEELLQKECEKRNSNILPPVKQLEMVPLVKLLTFERSLMGSSFKSFGIVRELGRGSFSIVFEVDFREYDDTKLAMKIVFNKKYEGGDGSYEIHRRLIEGEFVHRLPMHPNLLRIHYCFIGKYDREVLEDNVDDEFNFDFYHEKTAFFITPMCDGSLSDIRDARGVERPVFDTDAEFFAFLRDVVSGLFAMKQVDIIHCDLKEDNIFFKGKYTFMIGDYGLCYDFSKDKPGFREKCEIVHNKNRRIWGGKSEYQPPEIKGRIPHGQSVNYDKYDVYSLGVICWNLFTTRPLKNGKLRESECKNARIRELVEKMLKDYEERISISELMKEVVERNVVVDNEEEEPEGICSIY